MRACRPLPFLSWLVLPWPVFDMCQSVPKVSHRAHEWFTPKVRLRHASTGSKITWNSSKKSRRFFLGISCRSHRAVSIREPAAQPWTERLISMRWQILCLLGLWFFYQCDSCWCLSCVLHHCLKKGLFYEVSFSCLSTRFSNVHRIVLEHL